MKGGTVLMEVWSLLMSMLACRRIWMTFGRGPYRIGNCRWCCSFCSNSGWINHHQCSIIYLLWQGLSLKLSRKKRGKSKSSKNKAVLQQRLIDAINAPIGTVPIIQHESIMVLDIAAKWALFTPNLTLSCQCWQNVGKMLAKCWQNVGKMLAKCWQNIDEMSKCHKIQMTFIIFDNIKCQRTS